jgi:hypothetical protein
VPRELRHISQAAIGLHEVDGHLFEALVKPGLEGLDVPAAWGGRGRLQEWQGSWLLNGKARGYQRCAMLEWARSVANSKDLLHRLRRGSTADAQRTPGKIPVSFFDLPKSG